ncbi:MAG: HAD-IA family hydrolase [Oscillospiraceae bacterium]|nr:HAD-IA family hydrolase [Oscillospiraceae bacterium]
MQAVVFDMFETLITQYGSPPCFREQLAETADIPPEQFGALWGQTETARTLGQLTLEEALRFVLRGAGRESEALVQQLAEQRKAAKEVCFRHLHPEILSLLEALKGRGLRIGLVSNCFSEEAAVIRQSPLISFFDGVCLSCEEGVQKPDQEIFVRCVNRLGVSAKQCLYVGDGGSKELEAASSLGMRAVQAMWYRFACRKEEFPGAKSPFEVLEYL